MFKITSLCGGNYQQILCTLFPIKEREQILAKAIEKLPGIAWVVYGQRVEGVDCTLPRSRPQMELKHSGRRSHSEYHQVFLEGMEQAGWNPTNISKVAGVKHGPDEIPSAFLGTYQLHTLMCY